MVVTSYLIARSEFSSTFTLPTLTLPANWSAILSMVGDSWRHGPHQGAQKSTRTGWADWATSACQFSDVNSTTFLLAIADSVTSGGAGRPPAVDRHFSQGARRTPGAAHHATDLDARRGWGGSPRNGPGSAVSLCCVASR